VTTTTSLTDGYGATIHTAYYYLPEVAGDEAEEAGLLVVAADQRRRTHTHTHMNKKMQQRRGRK
jgi:hypothetical protein